LGNLSIDLFGAAFRQSCAIGFREPACRIHQRGASADERRSGPSDGFVLWRYEATTDGLKNTDVHLFVYDSSGAEVAKDDLPGPKCSVKVTPTEDGQYKFVITNAGGANTVTFKVKAAK